MKMNRNGITRRDFLRGTAAGVGLAGTAARAATAPEAGVKSTVVLVRDVDAVDADGKANGEVLKRMLDEAVTALLDAPDPVAAWKGLFKPEDTVGIKTNVWRFLRTPIELEAAIKARLIEAGVEEGKIGIDDRGVRGNPVFQQANALINTRPMRTHHWSGVGSLIKKEIEALKKEFA